jgi:uncharacterized protein (TIGR02217 family)
MAATIHEVLLDPCYSAGARGGPEFSTAIISCPSGFRQRNINRQDHIGRWAINYDLLDEDALLDLYNFFLARQGMAYLFRFLPPEFNTIADANAHQFAVGDGVTTTFNLVTRHVSGPTTYTHRVTKPMAGGLTYVPGASTIKIFKDSVLQTSGVTVSSTTGAVTFSVAPANGAVLSWSGTFHLPVSFGRDTFDGTFDLGGVSGFGIEIIESLPVEFL